MDTMDGWMDGWDANGNLNEEISEIREIRIISSHLNPKEYNETLDTFIEFTISSRTDIFIRIEN